MTFASVISETAATMNQGEWKMISTSNEESILETDGGEYDIFDKYSSQMVYDPITDAVYYIGASHHGDFDGKFVKFDISTNTWSELTAYADGSTIIHGYDHNALDNRRSIFYAREPSSNNVHKYTIATSTWSTIPSAGTSYNVIADAFGYFSAIDRLVYINSTTNEINYYDPQNGKWDGVQNTGITMGKYHAQGCDLAGHGLYIFGGGNDTNNLWSIDTNKIIKSIGNPTGSLSINVSSDGGNGCFFLQDPLSGDLVLFHDNGNMYKWNPKDRWSLINGISSKMGVNSVDGHAGVSLPKYGVIMVVRRNNADVEVWLYKHAKYTITFPSVPVNLKITR